MTWTYRNPPKTRRARFVWRWSEMRWGPLESLRYERQGVLRRHWFVKPKEGESRIVPTGEIREIKIYSRFSVAVADPRITGVQVTVGKL